MPDIDLTPAAQEIARLAAAIDDSQLGGRTPCPDYTVAALLDHLMGLTLAFAWAARKSWPADGAEAPAPGGATAESLDPRWRELLPSRAADLAAAWHEPGALDGQTVAGGVTMPAEVMLTVALDELVVHGWDLSRATGQEFRVDDASLGAVFAFTEAAAQPEEAELRGKIFGPVVPVPAGAPLLDRALGYAGRDPHWAP